jgi:hypothetical protein
LRSGGFVYQSLELQARRKHDLALECGSTMGCIDNDRAALTIYAGDGIVEVDLVEEIEDVCAKLKVDPLFQ